MSCAPQRIDISLLSHTNVGKTTLARTLLRQDIGEVADRAHVTEIAHSHVLIETAESDTLVLWDTPGFGDSVRVLKRLTQRTQPVGWFLSQVWDRFADRPFWCSQQAMHTARESSDVILYVVNAGEDPSAAGYVDAEMRILGWIDKPVILLLNQLGPPRDESATRLEMADWRARFEKYAWVRLVLPFDAFARCWVQESTLLTHIEGLLGEARRPAFVRLRLAWKARNLDVFRQSMRALAEQIGRIAVDAEGIAERDVTGRARAWLGSLASGAEHKDIELERAQAALARRLDVEVRTTTETLVALHGLTGRATDEVLRRMGGEFAVDRPADADKASVWGGLVSGALGGLAADLGAGGLTFGAGALIGGVLGAFGARGLAKAYNLARGSHAGTVRWADEFLTSRLVAALVRYLAVAHYGRGRGDYIQGAPPEHWQGAVLAAVAPRQEALRAVWALRSAPSGAVPGAQSAAIATQLLPQLSGLAQEVLTRLYPECADVFR